MKLKRDYRAARSILTNIKTESQVAAAMEGVWKAHTVCPRPQRATFLKRLTPGQRAFLALDRLEGEVNNGGIHQYFWNSTSDLAAEAQAGLRLIGAKEHLHLFLRVLRLFPDRTVLTSIPRRRKALEKIKTSATERLFDDPFYKLEGRKRTSLQSLRQAYFKTHPDDFVLPAGQAEEPVLLAKPAECDYRIPRKKASLRGEKLHWALIAKLWDDYWEPLKVSKQAILDFLPGLSSGHRALIAIDILDKTILRLNGFEHFLSAQVGADVLGAEAATGLRLIQAAPYAALFDRALAASGNLADLNRRVTDQSEQLGAARKTDDEPAIQAARQAWRTAFDALKRKQADVADSLDQLSAEFKSLLTSPDHKIETYIEAYVDAHPDEFFR